MRTQPLGTCSSGIHGVVFRSTSFQQIPGRLPPRPAQVLASRCISFGVLVAHGVHVIPDFLCNAGGVTVSYLEIVQNAHMYYWDEGEVHDKLDKRITAAYHSIVETTRKYGINPRQAAYVLAANCVMEAMKTGGWL